MKNVLRGLVFASLTACGTGGQTPTGKPVASADDAKPVAVDPRVDGLPDAPHRFRPQAHPPHVRTAPPPPSLGALPPLVARADACFDTGRDRRAPPSVAVGGGTVGGAPGSATRGGSSWGGGVPASSPPPPAPKAPAKGAEGRAASADAGAPAGLAGVAPEPVAASPARPDSPARESKDKRSAPPRAEAAAEVAAAPMADDEAAQPVAPEAEPVGPAAYDGWGAAIYLSNDDSMSLSSAQRVLFAVDNFLPIPPEHVRPHELLNYFSFATAPVESGNDFSVHGSMLPIEGAPGLYGLGLAVRSFPVTKETRRNAALTWVIDRSGSMSAEGRMSYLVRGLRRSLSELKSGDLLNVVLFDHEVCTPVENFVVGRDDPRVMEDVLGRLAPRGSTDVHAGLTTGYALADRSYQGAYTNRVVLVTDALANTGVTDEGMIPLIGKHYEQRRIRLSGVGVGREFNDELLDRLTERGRGAYVFLGSEAEVDAVFGGRFVSLIETSANDVHFRLHLPPSLRMKVFFGEESSTVKEDVQAIHYFANTSQLFLQDVEAWGGAARPDDEVMLTIEYQDPETDEERVEEYALRIGDMLEDGRNAQKGRLIMRFIDGLAWMAGRTAPAGYSTREGGWSDADAFAECQRSSGDLDHMARGVTDDPEVKRVLSVWDKYCARYDQPRGPVRRETIPPDAWPGAR